MYIGKVDPVFYTSTGFTQSLTPVVLTSTDPNGWTFAAEKFSFGISDKERDATIFVNNYEFMFDVGYNGFGLPSESFARFLTYLDAYFVSTNYTSFLYACKAQGSSGNFCWVYN